MVEELHHIDCGYEMPCLDDRVILRTCLGIDQ